MFIEFVYILLVGFEAPFLLKNGFSSDFLQGFSSNGNRFLNSKPFVLESEEYLDEKEAPIRPLEVPYQSRSERRIEEFAKSPISSLNFSANIMNLRSSRKC
ncbi:Galactosyltransferase [Abeliophyllum distichum]|uniref:Galactosyltransferase n=1 Tax=Abeliophyllum distichum TaxID=126358 RepID=A0ABD1P9J1_9LAMI